MQKAIFSEAYCNMVGQLRSKRIAMGMSQREVARRLRVQRSWLTRVEICQVRLDPVQLIFTCQVLKLSAHKLVRQLEGEMSEGDEPPYLSMPQNWIMRVVETAHSFSACDGFGCKVDVKPHTKPHTKAFGGWGRRDSGFCKLLLCRRLKMVGDVGFEPTTPWV